MAGKNQEQLINNIIGQLNGINKMINNNYIANEIIQNKFVRQLEDNPMDITADEEKRFINLDE